MNNSIYAQSNDERMTMYKSILIFATYNDSIQLKLFMNLIYIH
jgi:hypothetical protein